MSILNRHVYLVGGKKHLTVAYNIKTHINNIHVTNLMLKYPLTVIINGKIKGKIIQTHNGILTIKEF